MFGAVLAVASAIAVVACSTPGESSPQCPGVSMDCPSPQPSWATEVQPLIQARCYMCHSEGGIEWPKWDLSSYSSASMNRMEVLTQVFHCWMPPGDASPPVPLLTNAERQTIVQWIACGAPDN
jgi:uncharacterized membrane protein